MEWATQVGLGQAGIIACLDQGDQDCVGNYRLITLGIAMTKNKGETDE
jgi:hypothetical protein